jgi:hypothetical protein
MADMVIQAEVTATGVDVIAIRFALEPRGDPPAEQMVLTVTYRVLRSDGRNPVRTVGMVLPEGKGASFTAMIRALGGTPGASPNFAAVFAAASEWAQGRLSEEIVGPGIIP